MEENEQHSRLNSVGKDEPLLVLKYKHWRIAWRLFFPYSIMLPTFYMIVFYWAPLRQSILKIFIHETIAIILLVFMAFMFIDMILTKEFILYSDRVEKKYRIFGNKKMLLSDSEIIITWLPSTCIRVLAKGNFFARVFNIFFFDCNLMGGKCLEEFKEACKLV